MPGNNESLPRGSGYVLNQTTYAPSLSLHLCGQILESLRGESSGPSQAFPEPAHSLYMHVMFQIPRNVYENFKAPTDISFPALPFKPFGQPDVCSDSYLPPQVVRSYHLRLIFNVPPGEKSFLLFFTGKARSQVNYRQPCKWDLPRINQTGQKMIVLQGCGFERASTLFCSFWQSDRLRLFTAGGGKGVCLLFFKTTLELESGPRDEGKLQCHKAHCLFLFFFF